MNFEEMGFLCPVGQSPLRNKNFAAYYPQMHYVYVLKSVKTGRFYIGYSLAPEDRLETHNSGGNVSTKNGIPWQLIYQEGYLDKRDALGREKFLKSGSGHTYLKKQMRYFLSS